MENLNKATSPVERFIHEAQVLPYFDLGDELETLRTQHGEDAAVEAEQAYRTMKEETK